MKGNLSHPAYHADHDGHLACSHHLLQKGNLLDIAYHADIEGQLLAYSHHLLQKAICTMPTMQIVRGSYLPIASSYSKGLKDLVDMTLRTDPKRRPTVNEVLKTPVMQERIAKFLSATVRSASRNIATTCGHSNA